MRRLPHLYMSRVESDPGYAVPGQGDLLERSLGGLQQRLALAPALLAQAGVEAHYEALAGEVRAGDLGDR